MRKLDFEQYLQKKELKSAKGYVSYARTIERTLGVDLDVELSQGHLGQLRLQVRARIPKYISGLNHYAGFYAVSPMAGHSVAASPAPKQPVSDTAGCCQGASFWCPSNFAGDDCINRDIWSHCHQAICCNGSGRLAGMTVGAQQALLERGDINRLLQNPSGFPGMRSCGKANCACLPWVPDLVGKKWREKEGILIFGSAYAGFIQGYSKRCRGNKGIPVCDYASASDYWNFQEKFFIRQVVRLWQYYKDIEALIGNVGLSSRQIVLGDICRASFVVKHKNNGVREDQQNDTLTSNNKSIFNLYAQANTCWTWARISGTEGHRILCLGTLAYDYLEKAFQCMGASPIPHPSLQSVKQFSVAQRTWSVLQLDHPARSSYNGRPWTNVHGWLNRKAAEIEQM